MLLAKTPWPCPSRAHHLGPSLFTETKGQTPVKEGARGQLEDLTLLGFGSQQARKSPLAPRDSSTPEGHGDTDATGFPCVPIAVLTPLSRASHIPLPEGGARSVLGRPGTGLRLTAPCDSGGSQLLREPALAAPSHKHRWERVTLQLQLTNTRPAAC